MPTKNVLINGKISSDLMIVRREGVEPSRVSPYASETYAYANSATPADYPKYILLK